MTSPHPTADRAAERVVDALVGARLLDAGRRADSLAVVARTLVEDTAPTGSAKGLPRLVEVVAYLGGALVLAAGSLFLAEEWGTLGFGTRVVLLVLVTLVLLGAGVVAAQGVEDGEDRRAAAYDTRRRLAGTLLTGGAVVAAFLVGLLIDHGVDHSYDGHAHVEWAWAAGGGVAVLVALAGRRLAATAVSLVVMASGVLTAVLALSQGLESHDTGDVVAVALLVAAAVWLAVTERGLLAEVSVARSLGVVLAFVGAQAPVVDGHAALGYAVTAGLAAAAIALYLARVAWPYLAVAVVAVTVVVPEAVTDWSGGSLGATGGVLLAGVTLLIASFAGYRLRSETAG